MLVAIKAFHWLLGKLCGCYDYVRIKDLLEDILEASVVALEDGVLGTQIERPLLLQSKLETAVSEANDRLCGEK